MTCTCVLALVGLRTVLAPRPPIARSAVTVRGDGRDLPAEAFAESFARVYLTWDSASPDAHDAAVSAYAATDLGPGAGVSVPSSGRQSVRSTTVSADATGPHGRSVTVQAETSAGTVHLAVPVARDTRGLLYIAGYPALVGPPPSAPSPTLPSPGEAIADQPLNTVVGRALGNFVAGRRGDLVADLAPGALVVAPDRRLQLLSIRAVTWIHNGRELSAEVSARDESGASLVLQYDLAVVRRAGRWFVQSVSNP